MTVKIVKFGAFYVGVGVTGSKFAYRFFLVSFPFVERVGFESLRKRKNCGKNYGIVCTANPSFEA